MMARTPAEILDSSRRRHPEVYRDADRRDFARAIAARVLGKLRNQPPERIARKAWGDEGRLPLLTRAPVAPVAALKSSPRAA
jgi:hypothetical protein